MILLTNDPSRPTPADEDGQSDHIGYDTPRSGIATPQPDLHDKRLPGIMSYFGQVGSTCSSFLSRPLSSSRTPETESSRPTTPQEEKESGPVPDQLPSPGDSNLSKDSTPDSTPDALPLLPHERIEPLAESETSPQISSSIHPYPTPPCSKTPSEQGVKLGDASGDSDAGIASGASSSQRSSVHAKRPSDLSQMKPRRSTLASPLTSIVTTSSVHASHLSNPSDHSSTSASSPQESQVQEGEPGSHFSKSASIHQLKKLTNVGSEKSGPSTPTRTMSSAARPSQSEGRSPSKPSSSSESTEASGREASLSSRTSGAQPPAQKGKLMIKILEARGLRKSRDPYVVVVFQRSELISSGPRTFEDEDELMPPAPTTGSVPIQRQGSDSGRPMAIPMRSRQSSNTSVSDHNTFRSRDTRKSFTNPKWDAEAFL